MPALPAASGCRLTAATSGAGASGAAGEVTVDDTGLAEIVRRHFQRDFIPGQNADVVLAHFAAGVGNNIMAVVQRDAETGIGQYFSDKTTHFDEFFFGHETSLCKSG